MAQSVDESSTVETPFHELARQHPERLRMTVSIPRQRKPDAGEAAPGHLPHVGRSDMGQEYQ